MDSLLVQFGAKICREGEKAEKLKQAFEAARQAYLDQLDRCDNAIYNYNKRVVELKQKNIIRQENAKSEWNWDDLWKYKFHFGTEQIQADFERRLEEDY